MISFIDLDTGYVFDGNPPYIFWFKGGQSTNIIYNTKIGVVSDNNKIIIELPDNEVFKLIDINKINNELDGDEYFKYHKIEKLYSNGAVESIGYKYDDKYIHILYFTTCSENEGEFIEKFTIDGNQYEIGADFYNEDERLNINLKNYGIEIPDSIQKAIYDTSVHEDNKDNILINRKFKELISNYWDMISNKGSYKSLINSLNWFEWGDVCRLKEIWKHSSANKIIYNDQNLKSILENKYKDSIIKFSKTTYLALYTSMQKISSKYDSEMNPILEEISSKWSKIDLSLKMSMLGNFYEVFFMPIHLDLIHSTIEDIVFTNTIKVFHNTRLDRTDWVGNFDNVICNIQEGQIFTLGDVRAQVGPDTVFGVQWSNEDDYDDIYTIGIEDEVSQVSFERNYENASPIAQKNLKTFYSQMYTGVGVIIPVTLEWKMRNNDFIKYESILLDIDGNQKTFKEFYKIYKPDNGILKINFNLLCTQDGTYNLKFHFISGDSHSYIKNISFNVIDNKNITLKIYKVMRDYKVDINKLINSERINEYILSRQPVDKNKNTYYLNYVPMSKTGGSSRKNHILIFKGDYTNKDDDFFNNYYMLTKTIDVDGEEKIYTICISKKFNYNPMKYRFEPYKNDLIRNDYGYFPEFHHLYEIGGDKLIDYTFIDNDLLCVVPEIKFGKLIKDYEWVFENASDLTKITLPSIKEPYIANTKHKPLSKGYYNIIFKYSLIDGTTNEIKLNSAFLKR